MSEFEKSKTSIEGDAQKKEYEKGALLFADSDREVKILWTKEILIGRELVCDIVLNDKRVSRKHAVVHLDSDGVKLVDLMSSNGTTRNNMKVEGTIILTDGDKVVLGGAVEIDVKIREDKATEKPISALLKVGNTEYLLTQTEVLIGRNPEAVDIVIHDLLVSTLHAQLEFIYNVAVLTCLDTEKKMLINNSPVDSAQLEDGTSIQVGSTKMMWLY